MPGEDPKDATRRAPPPSGFDQAYGGRPPWDIGRPQREVLRLADGGEFVGDVLDIGCGTGENALELARRGLVVWGVDASPNAVRLARAKAAERGGSAHFQVGDAFHLDALDRTFDSVLDCGLFHVFDDAERRRYIASLARVLRSRGRYFVLAFSDAEPTDWGGPRRVTEGEIRAAFDPGWAVDYVRPARFETNLPGIAGHAWCARITRAGP